MLYADRTENSRKIICELWRDIMTLTEEEVIKVLSFYEGLKFKEKMRKGNDMNELRVIEYKNQRVLMTKQLAESYDTDTRRISENFNANKERYQIGKHYFCLEGESKRDFLNYTEIADGSINATFLYLWTEHGALLHAKSLGTDKAWEVYEQLIETYFRARELYAVPHTFSEALYLAANLQKQIEDLKPKADYTDLILKSGDLVTITQIAKDYGMTGRAMNAMLHEFDVQYKESNQWLLYKKHQGNGYTHSETASFVHNDGTSGGKMHTKWTQAGRLFLYELLKKNKILPMIERDLCA